MATLMAVYNSEGCVGRCDARCYNAIHPNCTCICGGRNHGKGEAFAVLNVTLHAATILSQIMADNPEVTEATWVNQDGQQLLPLMEDMESDNDNQPAASA